MSSSASSLRHVKLKSIERFERILFFAINPFVIVVRAVGWRQQSLCDVSFGDFANVEIRHMLVFGKAWRTAVENFKSILVDGVFFDD